MKKSFLLLFSVCLTFLATYAQPTIYNDGKSTAITLASSSQNETVINFNPGQVLLQEVETPTGTQYKVMLDEATPILKAGAPDLPKLTTSIIVPNQAAMEATVTASSYTDMQNVNIAPSKGSIKRKVDPATVAFTYSDVYITNQFYPQQIVALNSPYIIRDYRGQTVVVNPVQYNPVTKTLRVYNSITVKVAAVANGAPVNNPLFRTGFSTTEAFDQLYNKRFLNYNTVKYAASAGARYTPVSENGNMLIICYQPFMPLMRPFINWKEQEGIPVEMVDADSLGNDRGTIKGFVANYYQTKGLTYLLLVGDAGQVPPSETGAGVSDIDYGYIVGNDHYPDIFVGRFSAEQPEDVITQVARTIRYEKNPAMGNWFKHGVCIASNFGPGNDNLYDWQQERNIRNEMLGFTYSDMAELYDGDHSAGGVDAPGYPTTSDLVNQLDSGVSIVNYTGHGDDRTLITTGFSTYQAAQLTNTNRLPFMWIVGCQTGGFVSNTCLAEALLRAEDSAKQPTGAIANFSSTIDQYWDEPMEAQIGFNNILTSNDTFNNVTRHNFGAICENGCMQMNDKYDSTGFDMTDTWVCFGDPSVMVRTDVPPQIEATHAPAVWLGINSFQVYCNTNGAKVCLWAAGQILGTGIVSNNSVTITFDSPLQITADTLLVTATYFNKIPYQGPVLILDNAAGVQAIAGDSYFTVYPNPSEGNATISYSLSTTNNVSVSVFNTIGQMQKTFAANETQISGPHQYSLNGSSLTAGMYIVELTAGDKKYYKKLVVE